MNHLKKVHDSMVPPTANINETTDYFTIPRRTESQRDTINYGTYTSPIPRPSHYSSPPTLNHPPLTFPPPSPVTEDSSSEDFYIDPGWDDMVTFRQLRLPYRSSATSFIDPGYDETSSILGIRPPSSAAQPATYSPFTSFLFHCTNKMITRYLLLVMLPVFVVTLWCAIPLQVEDRKPGSDGPDTEFHMKFWFFLLVYYGFYNFTALLMVNQYFQLYSFHWWPKSVGGVGSTIFFWGVSMVLGTLIYLFTPWYKSIYAWVILTFVTLMMPVFSAFLVIRKENRNVYRHSLTEAQKVFLLLQDSRIPSSYKRFLWFGFTLLINYIALLLGETYARFFTAQDNKSWFAGLVYVYTWVITVFILDTITDYVVESRIRSWALSHIYKLYYALIYFVFYRNLFIKLRSPEQFYTVQIGSSLWVLFNYPIRMSQVMYRITTWFGSRRSYSEYCKNVGRSFFIRNLAENVSMVGFLCWVNVLHFGPNSRVYPYFDPFDPGLDESTSYPLTISASLGVWGCEIFSAFLTRRVFKAVFNHSVTREAVQDFYRYPDIIWAMVLVTIHVLQDMLLALIDLDTLQ